MGMNITHTLARIAKFTIPGKLSSRSVSKQGRVIVITVLSVLLLAAPATAVFADTTPPAGTPATVSADPLPTVQIDGIVWKQAILGNKVYATGKFTTARPAGVAKGGTGTVTRDSLIKYDITTGAIDTTFVHTLTGGTAEGKGIAISPDGTRLYVGGGFTTVDGQAHANFAAFDLTTNKVLSGFSGVNGKVNSVAATNTQAYLGGYFSAAGGQARSKLAAFNANGTINTGWRADVTGTNVAALAVTKTQGNLVVGGSFTKINGATYYSLGAVKLTTGANVSWASQSSSFPIRMQPPSGSSASALGITSLSADASQVYLTAFTYLPGIKHPGSFEGRAAISPTTGALIWANDCQGDSYDAFPVGQVLYSVSHAHNCTAIGGYPSQESQRALAETTYKTGTNGPGVGGNYPSFQGIPDGTLLNWFPVLNTGTVSGSGQAAWSVVGNSNYIALGGEFTTANGTPQQGLVRYAVKAFAPNKIGPLAYSGRYHESGYTLYANPADSTGKSLVRIYPTSDPDNGPLTYAVTRKGSSTVLATKTVESRFWKSTSWSFTDSGVAKGTSLLYSMTVKDAFGNTRIVADPTIINDTDTRIVYSTSSGTTDFTSSQNRNGTMPDVARGIHYTKRNGASYSLTFTGTSVKLITEKNPDRGNVGVSIDGGTAVTVSQNATSNLFQQTIFSKTGLTNAKHTIKVTKLSGTYMDLDGIVVR